MNDPVSHKVSIIIPAYNEQEQLPLCLESIQGLDWPENDLEVIIVDNGSTDNTITIAESFGAKVLEDPSKNVSGLRNLGAKHAKGKILAFLDADCLVRSDWLKIGIAQLYQNNVVICGGPPVPPENSSWVQRAWYLMVKPRKTIERVDWIGTANLFVRKEAFSRLGGFNEELKTCEDVDFCYRAAEFGDIVSNRNIRIVHLREADTLPEFFRKEVWRGGDNLSGLVKHGALLKEIRSIIVPFYFILIVPFTIAVLYFYSHGMIYFISAGIFLLPGLLGIIKSTGKKATFCERIQLSFLLYIYFAARSVAILKPGK